MYICLVVGFNVSLCVHTSINKKFILRLVWFKMTKTKVPRCVQTSIERWIFYKVHLDMRLVWFLIANTKFKSLLDKRLAWFINTNTFANTKVKMHLDTRLVWLPERARLNLERLDLLLAYCFAVFMLSWWPSDLLLLPHCCIYIMLMIIWFSPCTEICCILPANCYAIFLSYLVMIIKLGN